MLDVVGYATNVTLRFGQEHFHALFTLFAPFGIPIYRYCADPTLRYNFSLRQWILYSLAYCFLLLVTRDVVEFVTCGNPFLDKALTLCRITLAVFWYSMMGYNWNVTNFSPYGIWNSTVVSTLSLLPTSIYPSLARCDRWVAALFRRSAMPLKDRLYILLGQATYDAINLTWHRTMNRLAPLRSVLTVGALASTAVACVAIYLWFQFDYRHWLPAILPQVMAHGQRIATQSINLINTPLTNVSNYFESSDAWLTSSTITGQAGLLEMLLLLMSTGVVSPIIATLGSSLTNLACLTKIKESVSIYKILHFAQATSVARAWTGRLKTSPHEYGAYALAWGVLDVCESHLQSGTAGLLNLAVSILVNVAVLVDWPLYVSPVTAFAKGSARCNYLCHHLPTLIAIVALVPFGLIVRDVYVRHAPVLSSHPPTILQLGPSVDDQHTSVHLSQEVSTWAQPGLARYASTALASLQAATKAYQGLASPSAILMYLAPHENPITLFWQALKKCLHNVVAIVYPPAKEQPRWEVVYFVQEIVHVEVFLVGQVCHDEAGIELPCEYEPEDPEETSIVDAFYSGLRRVAGYFGIQ